MWSAGCLETGTSGAGGRARETGQEKSRYRALVRSHNVKIREGQVANRPIYLALAVTVDGGRDILSLWVGEGAKYWLRVLTEHVRQVAGLGHVGLGGDFDGTPDVTVGLEDVSTYPALFAELLTRGWSEADCAALAGGNLLRVLRAAESAARTPLPGLRAADDCCSAPPRLPAVPEPLRSHR